MGVDRLTPKTPNQTLQQTAGAILVSGTSSSLWPPPLLSWVVRRRRNQLPEGGVKTLTVLLAALGVWVVGYRLLGRLLFPDRLKKWEVMEDMASEGVQTSCLLLVSGLGAAGVVLVGLVVWAWR